ncbi:MAG: TIGR03862 family flavoprotein [Gammaproteobacteria bacterium]
MDPFENPKAAPLVAIIGAGPAGLAAAELLAPAYRVHVFDSMPAPARKFLLAGKSGLNLTHAEPFAAFQSRYDARSLPLEAALRAFPPEAVRAWSEDLGCPTFVGSSGRVFPRAMKASPLLRAWLKRLDAASATLHLRHRFIGWSPTGALSFATPEGERPILADATLLAVGGASWPRLGTDDAWVDLLQTHGVDVAALAPANCGFDARWPSGFAERFAGTPLRGIGLCTNGAPTRGDVMITADGIEGGPVYTLSRELRDALIANGPTTVTLDLAPDRTQAHLTRALARPHGKSSVANHLRKATGLAPEKRALVLSALAPATPEPNLANTLARLIKALPLTLTAPRPIAEAISSAGGVRFAALTDDFMLRAMPGVFAAGEMLDWEAPTGGYLLTACLATGRAAARGIDRWLQQDGA